MATPRLLANLRSFVLPLTAAGVVPAVLLARIGWAPALASVPRWMPRVRAWHPRESA